MNQADTFADFVTTRSPRLLRTAFLLTHDWALAEDLLQTSLVKAWGAWRRIDGDPEPYVRRIMINTYSSWWQRRWRGEQPASELPESTVDGEHAAIDARDQVWRALGRLLLVGGVQALPVEALAPAQPSLASAEATPEQLIELWPSMFAGKRLKVWKFSGPGKDEVVLTWTPSTLDLLIAYGGSCDSAGQATTGRQLDVKINGRFFFSFECAEQSAIERQDPAEWARHGIEVGKPATVSVSWNGKPVPTDLILRVGIYENPEKS